MKKLVFLLLLCITVFQTISAHPGSLDSNGGHYNRKTGEYHYHEGVHTENNSNPSLKESPSTTNKQMPIIEKTQEASKSNLRSQDADSSFFSKIGIGGWLIISILLIGLIYGLIYDTKFTLSTIILLPIVYVSFLCELLWELLRSFYSFFKKLLYKLFFSKH